MRNLARPIDTFSPLVVLGVLMIFFSRKGQRLGDLMAQTLVIRETEIDWSQFDEPVFNEVSSENRVQPVGTLRLTPRQWEMVQGFLYRREGLEPAARSRVADRLCAELKNVVQGTDLETLALPPEEWLAEVIRRG